MHLIRHMNILSYSLKEHRHTYTHGLSCKELHYHKGNAEINYSVAREQHADRKSSSLSVETMSRRCCCGAAGIIPQHRHRRHA